MYKDHVYWLYNLPLLIFDALINYIPQFLRYNLIKSGAAPQGNWEEQSPTPHKYHFCKSSKIDEKIVGVWPMGGG